MCSSNISSSLFIIYRYCLYTPYGIFSWYVKIYKCNLKFNEKYTMYNIMISIYISLNLNVNLEEPTTHFTTTTCISDQKFDAYSRG